MNKIFGNSLKRRIAILFLEFFIFSFLHSELGFLDFDSNKDACVDYCDIIKNADTHSKILREELPAKLALNKVVCIHCAEEIEAQATKTYFEITDKYPNEELSADIYLFNRTLLI